MKSNEQGTWVGAKLKRKEDHRLTSGRGESFGDVKVPGALELILVRSDNGPCPHTPLGTRGVGEGTPGPVAWGTCERRYRRPIAVWGRSEQVADPAR